jgi:hypothetical protein
MKPVLLLILALACLQAAQPDSPSKERIAVLPPKPSSADVYFTVQYEGKEYAISIPKKGCRGEVVLVLEKSNFKPVDQAEMDALVSLGTSMLKASLMKKAVVLKKETISN